jgi:AcrR family transcriptional regulator
MARTIRDPGARERIVEAAAEVVAERGIAGATVRAIASHAGVSTGFVTHYFEDKDELMVAVLEATNARAARRVARGDGPALERLRAAVEALMPFDAARRRDWQVWVAVWTQASPDSRLAAGYRAGWSGLRSILAGLLVTAREEGALRTTDEAYDSERLVTLLAGVGLLAGVEKPARVRAIATRMIEDELERLGARPARPRAA